MEKGFLTLFLVLLAGINSFAVEKASFPVDFFQELDSRWTITITSGNYNLPCAGRPLLIMSVTDINMPYQYKSRSGEDTVYPRVTLYFYEKFTSDQKRKFMECSNDILNSPAAHEPPFLFLETDKHDIYSSTFEKRIRNDTEKEMYRALRALLKEPPNKAL